MKRIFTLVVLAVAMTMTAQAQGIKFGVKAGLNITKMSISKDVFDSKNKAGFFVGPTLKLSLPMGFGADIALTNTSLRQMRPSNRSPSRYL